MNSKVIQISIKPNTPKEPGLPKAPVKKGTLTKQGLKGDHNNFRAQKKGNNPDMAVLFYPIESIIELNKEGWPIRPGDLGENLTTSGVLHSKIFSGQQFQVGDAIVEISFECDPCKNLSTLSYVGGKKINAFIKTLIHRRGWYAKVIKPGTVYPGDPLKQIK